MILNTSQEFPKAKKRLLNDVKCKLRPKCGENMRKLTNAPSFCHTASLRVGSGWGKTRMWLLKYDIRHNKGASKSWKNAKCKSGLKCGENIQNLADAPCFCHTTWSPRIGSHWSSMPSKHSDSLKYDRRHDTGVPKSWINGYCMV